MTKPFPFTAVIFDMDGVLVDTEWAYKQELVAFSEDMGFGLTDAELNALVGTSSKVFENSLVEWYGRIGCSYDVDTARDAYRAWSNTHVPLDFASLLNPGVRETLDDLHARGVRTALASSSPMRDIEAVLAACKLEGAFETVVSGEQFHESKPNPEIYLHSLDLLGLPADVCCCVEDSVPGITAGKAAGLTVFAKREERFGFSQDAADVVIDQIPDLLTAAYEVTH